MNSNINNNIINNNEIIKYIEDIFEEKKNVIEKDFFKLENIKSDFEKLIETMELRKKNMFKQIETEKITLKNDITRLEEKIKNYFNNEKLKLENERKNIENNKANIEKEKELKSKQEKYANLYNSFIQEKYNFDIENSKFKDKRKIFENEKEKLKKEKSAFEKDKELLEKEKSKLENEKLKLENEKKNKEKIKKLEIRKFEIYIQKEDNQNIKNLLKNEEELKNNIHQNNNSLSKKIKQNINNKDKKNSISEQEKVKNTGDNLKFEKKEGEKDNMIKNSDKINYFPKGLENIGFCCYINSLLQCLYYIKDFRDYFINEKDNFEKEYQPFCVALSEVMYGLKYGKNDYFIAKQFKEILGNKNNKFYEVKEFLNKLLKELNTELNTECSKSFEEESSEEKEIDLFNKLEVFKEHEKELDKNIISELFIGFYETSYYCPNNNNKITYSFQSENFLLFE